MHRWRWRPGVEIRQVANLISACIDQVLMAVEEYCV